MKETTVIRVSKKIMNIIRYNGLFGETPSQVLERIIDKNYVPKTTDLNDSEEGATELEIHDPRNC